MSNDNGAFKPCEGCLSKHIHKTLSFEDPFNPLCGFSQGHILGDRLCIEFSASKEKYNRNRWKINAINYDAMGYLCVDCMERDRRGLRLWQYGENEALKNIVTIGTPAYMQFIKDYGDICAVLGLGIYEYNTGELCCFQKPVRLYGYSTELDIINAYNIIYSDAESHASNTNANSFTITNTNTSTNSSVSNNVSNTITNAQMTSSSVSVQGTLSTTYSTNTTPNQSTNNVSHSSSLPSASTENSESSRASNNTSTDQRILLPLRTHIPPVNKDIIDAESNVSQTMTGQQDKLVSFESATVDNTNYEYWKGQRIQNGDPCSKPKNYTMFEVNCQLQWYYNNPKTAVSKQGQLKQLSTEFMTYMHHTNHWRVRSESSYQEFWKNFSTGKHGLSKYFSTFIDEIKEKSKQAQTQLYGIANNGLSAIEATKTNSSQFGSSTITSLTTAAGKDARTLREQKNDFRNTVQTQLTRMVDGIVGASDTSKTHGSSLDYKESIENILIECVDDDMVSEIRAGIASNGDDMIRVYKVCVKRNYSDLLTLQKLHRAAKDYTGGYNNVKN